MTSSTPADTQSSREAILGMLEDSIDDLHEQIMTAELDSRAAEELHLKRIHELGYLANQYRKLQRDSDLDEMQDELAFLTEDEP